MINSDTTTILTLTGLAPNEFAVGVGIAFSHANNKLDVVVTALLPVT